MIISHKNRFIFLKSQKTGGTSLELALSRFCGHEDVVTPLPAPHEERRVKLGGIGPSNTDVPLTRHTLRDLGLLLRGKGRRAFWQHSPAHEVRDWVGRGVWRDYFKFVVERNPWDRAISQYWFRMRLRDEPIPMLEFFETAPQHMMSNLQYYAIGNRVVVDRILRYETLEEEISSLSEQIGLAEPIEMPRANTGWRRDQRPYRDVLGDDEREVIARRCATEIELLGYEF